MEIFKMNKVRIAINGFGRIGRCVMRALAEAQRQDLELVALNAGFGDWFHHLHLLKYDSTHGSFKNFTLEDKQTISFLGEKVQLLLEMEPNKINWQNLGVDVVLECSGAFTDRQKAAAHLSSGIKKVIVSAPCDGADKTIVYGVNHHTLTANDQVISIGSCTTNCLAPVVKILNDEIGIKNGFMTTIHSYTNDQNVLDGVHKDNRRARACNLSMIPSSTGAAKALSLVLPEMQGKLDGTAVRVPTPNVSMIDFKFNAQKATSVDEINKIMRQAVQKEFAAIVAVTDEELVSIDFNHNPMSSTFDATQTKVIGGDLCRVVAWYDNEWGFSNRMLDMAALYGKL